VTTGTDVTLTITFNTAIDDVSISITTPVTTYELPMSNSGGNTWVATFDYDNIGTYTLGNYFVNSGSEIFESALTYEVTDIPIALNLEELSSESVTTGTDVTLTITFNTAIDDVSISITTPVTTYELPMSNSGGNTWVATFDYDNIGTYTLGNYFVNSGSEIFESALTYEVTDIPIALNLEELSSESVTTGTDVTLTITFNTAIDDVSISITTPLGSDSAFMSNTVGNTWSVTFDYTDVGTYTLGDYAVNSESEIFESALTYEVTEAPLESVTIVSEELSSESVTTGTDVTLTTEFDTEITNAVLSITTPVDTYLVSLTNIEGNVWTTTFDYTDVGTYTLNLYSINDDSETMNSALVYTVAMTPVVRSSSGGSSSYDYDTPVIDEINETNDVDVISENIDSTTINDVLRDYAKELIGVLTFIVVVFIYYNTRKDT
jgi:hypothetical protein